MTEPAANAPLDGIVVVEIGSSVAAPYATWILAALGARVVKIERPGAGDDARQWGEIFPDGTSSIFHAINRDKQSVTVDLKDPEDAAWLRGFVRRDADVVLQNLRPGHIARYGLDADSVLADSARVVYCNIWAFGHTGPMRDRPGYDPLMQAFGGLMSVTGETGRAPVRVGTSIIDMGTGMWCAIGILAALNRRAATGVGGVVDTSLYETSLGWMAYHVTGLQASGENPVRRGSGAPGMVPYQAYECSDGYLMVAAPNDRLFEKLAATIGVEDLPADERFASNQARSRNLDALNAVLEPVFRAHSRAHWRERLEAAGIPCAPDRTTEEVLACEQTAALGMVQHLAGTGIDLLGLPLSIDGERPALRNVAPRAGADTDTVKRR